MSAPNVIWEGDGVRVLEDGSFVTRFGGLGAAERAAYVLARAVVVLKKEADWARQNTRDVDRDRCNTINDLTRSVRANREDAARKAAEDMREWAAKVAVDANQRKRGTFDIARDIRALPLPGDNE